MPNVNFDRDYKFSGGVPYAPLKAFSGQEGAALANAFNSRRQIDNKETQDQEENALKRSKQEYEGAYYGAHTNQMNADTQNKQAMAQQRVIDSVIGPVRGIGELYGKSKKVDPATASDEVDALYAPVRDQLKSVGIPAPDRYDDKTDALFRGYMSQYIDKPSKGSGTAKETQKDRDDKILAEHYGVPVDVIKAGKAAGGGKVDDFFIDEWKKKQTPSAPAAPKVSWQDQAMSKVRGMFSGGSSDASSAPAEYPDAKQGKDGKWYVVRDGKTFKIER